MNFLKTHWYILMFYPFESIKNSITIVLSSYFRILEARAWHLLSNTYISRNVFKCILKHAIIQFYATKSKIFLLLIVKVKNIHEFNLLSLCLWILSTKKKNPSLAYFTMFSLWRNVDSINLKWNSWVILFLETTFAWTLVRFKPLWIGLPQFLFKMFNVSWVC